MGKYAWEEILERYVNGRSNEVSLYKNIPITALKIIKENCRGMFRYRYRGPSNPNYNRPPSYCLMREAITFSLYRV